MISLTLKEAQEIINSEVGPSDSNYEAAHALIELRLFKYIKIVEEAKSLGLKYVTLSEEEYSEVLRVMPNIMKYCDVKLRDSGAENILWRGFPLVRGGSDATL